MINHNLHIFVGGIFSSSRGPFLFLHLLLHHHIILHDDPGEGSVFKNYSCWDNFDWDLSRSRYQCEIHTQWENWAEGTLGHSDNSQGNRYTRQLWLGQTFIVVSGHIYIGNRILG